jgi:hypothetical protein
MRTRSRGAALLVPVLILITVAAFAVVVAASQSGGDIQGSNANADGLQALYLAETGLERALKRFATGTACDASLAETINDLSTIGLGSTSHRIVIGAALTTDFAGNTLPATQCRIPVTGTVLASSVTRTLHVIVSRNLLDGPANPDFDNPRSAGPPSGWTLNPAGSFAINGGPDGASPGCSRSAWQVKENTGGGGNLRRASGTRAVQFTLTPGSTTDITFHRRVVARSAACGAPPGDGPASLPAGCTSDGQGSTVCFQMLGAGGGPWSASANAGTSATTAAAACPSTYNPCDSSYQAGYPTKAAVSVAMAGATSVTQFGYYLQLTNQGGNTRKEIFIDHIEVTNDTAVGAAHIRVWRDCSTAACP